jgi:hypothetical protein
MGRDVEQGTEMVVGVPDMSEEIWEKRVEHAALVLLSDGRFDDALPVSTSLRTTTAPCPRQTVEVGIEIRSVWQVRRLVVDFQRSMFVAIHCVLRDHHCYAFVARAPISNLQLPEIMGRIAVYIPGK